MPLSTSAPDRAAVARAEHMRQAALRAADDPKQLARAVRIVGAGVERGVLNDTTINEFIASVSERRSVAGKPEKITVPAVYSLLDGLLVRRTEDA